MNDGCSPLTFDSIKTQFSLHCFLVNGSNLVCFHAIHTCFSQNEIRRVASRQPNLAGHISRTASVYLAENWVTNMVIFSLKYKVYVYSHKRKSTDEIQV